MTNAACHDEKQPKRRYISHKEHAELNKRMFSRDSLLITQYCIAHELDSVPNSYGIWLTINNQGTSDTIRIGDKICINYIISDMMSGEIFYRTDSAIGKRPIDKPYIIEAAKGQVISAIDDVLPILTDGSEATLVVQPDKAYGILGDENRIKGRRILVYKIKINKLEI